MTKKNYYDKNLKNPNRNIFISRDTINNIAFETKFVEVKKSDIYKKDYKEFDKKKTRSEKWGGSGKVYVSEYGDFMYGIK